MNTEFVKQCGSIQDELKKSSRNLDRFATGFFVTGNILMGEKLSEEVQTLKEIAESVNKMCGDQVANYVQSVGEDSRNMLNACLAGMEIAKKNQS
jgi:hypothetical protein